MIHGASSHGRRALGALLLVLATACGGGGGGGGGAGAPLSYTLPAFRVGFPFAVAPSVTITATAFSVAGGSLPPGFTLDAATGLLAGRPLAATGAPVLATIEATDGTTTVSSALSISISPAPAGRFVLVTNEGDHTLSVLALDAATGMAQHHGYSATGTVPTGVAVAPDGALVVTANRGTDDVSAFGLSPSGALTAVPGSPFDASADPIAVAIDPLVRFVYVLCEGGGSPVLRQYSVDGAGVLADLAPASVPTGAAPSVMAVDPLARFLFVAFGGAGGMVQPYAIDPGTGQLAAGTAVAAGPTPRALAVSPDGAFLFVARFGDDRVGVLSVDATTGALAPVGAVDVSGSGPAGLAVSADGASLYVALTSGAVERFAIASNGIPGSLGATTAPAGLSCVAVESSGRFVYGASPTANELTVVAVGAPAPRVALARLRAAPSGLAIAPGLAPVTSVASYLYASNQGDDDVTQFEVDPADGSLSPLVPVFVPTGSQPNWVEVHPFRDAVYSVNLGSATIEVFGMAAGGTLTSSQVVVQGGSSAWSLHVDPGGRFAYGINSAASQVIPYTVGAGGELTANGLPFSVGTLTVPAAAALHPTGKYLYVPLSQSDVVRQLGVNGQTGLVHNLTPISLPTAAGPIAAAVDPSGRFLFVACFGAPAVSAYSIHATTGALTELAASPFATSGEPIDVVADPDGRHVYLALAGSSAPGIETFDINVDPLDATEDGTLASTNVHALSGDPFKIRVNRAGTVLYATHAVSSGMVETFALDDDGLPTSIDIDGTGNTTVGLALRERLQ